MPVSASVKNDSIIVMCMRPLEAGEPPVELLLALEPRHRLVVPPLCRAQPEPHQPGRRVEQREGQRADQQRGHEPERPVEPGVVVLVVVRGVGQVAREPPVRAGVALGAGRDDVGAREVSRPGSVAAGCRALPWQSEHLAAPSVPSCETLPWKVSKKVSASSLWHWPHWAIIRLRKPACVRARRIVCAEWQSSQTGSCLPFFGDAGGVDALLERLLDAVVAAGRRCPAGWRG